MESRSVFSQIEQSATGATIRGINIFSLKRAKMPVPPPDEQRRIAQHLDKITVDIQALIDASARAIRLTKEHRAALITAAISGQIDVRTYKAKDLEEVIA